MSRLTQWLYKLTGVRGRKKARQRAYKSETLAVKIRLVEREQKSGGKSKR